MSRVVVDTCAYSQFRKGNADELFEVLKLARRVYVPVPVLGELYAGFRMGAHEASNRKGLEKFLNWPTVRQLETTRQTAERYSFIVAHLQSIGTPIPVNDIWIAAHALETGAALVTFDKHFEVIPGLRLVDV